MMYGETPKSIFRYAVGQPVPVPEETRKRIAEIEGRAFER